MYNQAIPRVKEFSPANSINERKEARKKNGSEPCFTAKEVAARLDIAVPTLNTWVTEGKFPHHDFYLGAITKRYWRMTPKLLALIATLKK